MIVLALHAGLESVSAAPAGQALGEEAKKQVLQETGELIACCCCGTIFPSCLLSVRVRVRVRVLSSCNEPPTPSDWGTE
jgi:hypothetical protein